MSEKFGNLIIFSLSFFIFLLLMLFYFLPSLSYYQSKKTISGNITVGQATFVFTNDLPLFDSIKNFQGGTINEELSVINARDRVGNNTKNLIDCYLRFTYTSTNAITPYINPAKFISSDDGYYYYKKIFNVGEIVRLIDFFEVGKISIEEYLNGINIDIKVDVMQASKNLILESFPTAPIDWINSIT